MVGRDLGHRNVHRKWTAYLMCKSESAWVTLWSDVSKNVINTYDPRAKIRLLV